MSTNGMKEGSRRPACGEDPGTLVQIGLPTGARSTGFEATRRDVLALLGFSMTAAGAAGCRAPTQKALPLPIASDQMVPGVANLYATTCGGCSSACSLVVRQRDGRPIKIEGNDASSLFGAGTCATGQATVLSLYDDARLRAPLLHGKPATWAAIDDQVARGLEGMRGDARDIVLLSRTLTSPSTSALLETIRAKHPRLRHVVYDAMSASAIRAASAKSFGVAAVPHYRFDQARVVVALDADFLGTWLSPVEFAHQYAKTRTQDGSRSFHVQVEPEMSVTGTNADLRIALAPSEIGPFAVALLGAVKRQGGGEALDLGAGGGASASPHAQKIEGIAARLLAHGGASLVVSGSEDPDVQTIVNALNDTLGNVGKTVDLVRPSLQRQGDDGAIGSLVDDMMSGKVGALLIWGANPVYDHPLGPAFAQALARVPLTVSFADRADETAAHVQIVAPDHHFLEAWGDAEPVAGFFSLRQPLIAPLFETRAAVESLIRWFQVTGVPSDAHEYLRAFWRTTLFPRHEAAAGVLKAGGFESFWDKTLERGVVELPSDKPAPGLTAFRGDWSAAAQEIRAGAQRRAGSPGAGGPYEIHLHETVGVREGSQTNNPWLLELPDPISRLTWGNVARLAPATATALGIRSGDVVSLATQAGKLEAPVFVQAGQHPGTISLAVGYGRWAAGKAGNGVGVNAYALAPFGGGVLRRAAPVTVAKVGRRTRLAPAQTHFSMEGRPIVQQTSVGAPEGGEEREALPNLWAERLHGEHSWGMSIDLDACTGCSACVVACQAENNVPVVGPTQIEKVRIMHWMRIDRYIDGDDEDATMVHQPMLCQHCQHAPCETVCPVLATSTSSEGINQQVYNRCIGTRYCANNCPYKVRRFNWHNFTANDDFDYNMASPLGRLVLNPDVAVRSRGVMEKCSLCVQRIQLGKNQALQERRAMADGDVQTACQQSCPTGAIVFGDLKDPESRVSKLLAGRRAYGVLEELGTRPNVGYLKKIKRSELA